MPEAMETRGHTCELITFCVSRSRGKMYIGHGRLCVSLSVCLSLAVFPHYCTDLDVTWENGRGCPVVVHCWADLQSVHGFCCYDNIVPNAKCQRVLVLALCWVIPVLYLENLASCCFAVSRLGWCDLRYVLVCMSAV